MKAILKKEQCQRALQLLRKALSSYYFIAFTAVFTLLCYYVGWDIVIIWYMALCGAAVLLLLKDVTPLITIFLFMNIMISVQHSPTNMGGQIPDEYFFQTAIVAQIGVAIGLFAAAGVFRLVMCIKNRTLKITPTFIGLCMFAAAMLLNGITSENYEPMNALYGFFMAFMFLGVFCIVGGNVTVCKDTFLYIAWAFMALTFCLIIELGVAYLTYDNLWVNGGLNREALHFGWGMYNTMGMLFTIAVPSAAYLAYRYRHGYFFTFYMIALTGAAYATMSRQAILCCSVITLICAVLILIKGRHRLINGIIFICAIVVGGIVAFIFRGIVEEVIDMLLKNFMSGSGRDHLYEIGMDAFNSSPIFGTGFYHDLDNDPGFIGLSIMPDMYHNTIVELLAVGGIVAFVTYVIHRAHTIISYIKNPTADRTYIAVTIFALLILSLLDNHIFYILPTLVYSTLAAMLIGSENVKKDAD